MCVVDGDSPVDSDDVAVNDGIVPTDCVALCDGDTPIDIDDVADGIVMPSDGVAEGDTPRATKVS